MKINARLLIKLGACPNGLARFNTVFPNGATVNGKTIDMAIKNELSMHWFVKHFAHGLYDRMLGEMYEEIGSRYYLIFESLAEEARNSTDDNRWIRYDELSIPVREAEENERNQALKKVLLLMAKECK